MSWANLIQTFWTSTVSEGEGADDYPWTLNFAPRNDDFENGQALAGQTGSVTGKQHPLRHRLARAQQPILPALPPVNRRGSDTKANSRPDENAGGFSKNDATRKRSRRSNLRHAAANRESVS
jgi:hypothetical protein